MEQQDDKVKTSPCPRCGEPLALGGELCTHCNWPDQCEADQHDWVESMIRNEVATRKWCRLCHRTERLSDYGEWLYTGTSRKEKRE